MKRSKSSRKWLQEHFNDDYVAKAKAAGYRSRAAYKLLEIQEKDKIIRPGMTVVDLGAAPGGWTQIAAKLAGPHGKVIALDLLPMDAISDVEFIQGDFLACDVAQKLHDTLAGQAVDLVISDMAPNISGMMAIDQPKMMCLAETALYFAEQVLPQGGIFLIKVFQGEGFTAYLQEMRSKFTKVVTRKPDASRARSRELYLLAQGFKAHSP